MNFLKNNACSIFLFENRDGHLAGLIEAKPYRKMCHFTLCKFSLQSLNYEFFKT